jgi:transposase InsO family protein
MIQSMSERPNCWINALIESFFKPLKVERLHQFRCETHAQARFDIVNWIEGYYNLERLHSSIDYQTPMEEKSGLMCA